MKNKIKVLLASVVMLSALSVSAEITRPEDFGINEILASRGDDAAQLNVGYLYYKGSGVKQSYKKAFMYFKQSAEQGNNVAQNNLGVMYSEGQYVEMNHAIGNEWYAKSIKQGNREAEYHLATAYLGAKGIVRDEDMALMLFTKSARKGNADAMYSLGEMSEEGNGLRKSMEGAKEWYGKACNANLTIGCDKYIEMRERGY